MELWRERNVTVHLPSSSVPRNDVKCHKGRVGRKGSDVRGLGHLYRGCGLPKWLMGKESNCNSEMQEMSQEDHLEEEGLEILSSILA